MSLLCDLFGHRFGEWQDDPQCCERVRICARDAFAERVVCHEWGEWLDEPNRCERYRVCVKDGAVERQASHRWSEWIVAPPGCDRRRSCAVHAVEEIVAEHSWGQWENGQRHCLRPGCAAEEKCVHSWEDKGPIDQDHNDLHYYECSTCREQREDRYDDSYRVVAASLD